jgi:hypothetical protein
MRQEKRGPHPKSQTSTFRLREMLSAEAGKTLFWAIVQQILVALSTVFLTRLVGAIHAGAAIGLWLGLYAAALTLPYIPGGLMILSRRAWARRAEEKFSEAFQSRWFGRPAVWGDSQIRDSNVAVFTKEGPLLIQDLTLFWEDLVVLALNAGLSILALAWVVDSKILITYALGLGLGFLLVRAQARRMGRLSQALEQSRLGLTHQRMQVWDNVSLGNRHSHQLWWNRFRDAFSKHFRDDQALSLHLQFFSTFSGWLMISPILALLVGRLVSGGLPPEQQLALVVIMPRLYMVMSASHDLLKRSMEWGSILGRWKTLSDSLNQNFPSIDSRVSYSKLHMRLEGESSAQRVTSLADILDGLRRSPRVTLRGENGAGKSSLCLLLKESLGDEAFLLPSHHQLALGTSLEPGSTGQRQVAGLKEVISQRAARVLLLDEWDANLDAANRDQMEFWLDRALGEGVRVVEIRHSSSPSLV